MNLLTRLLLATLTALAFGLGFGLTLPVHAAPTPPAKVSAPKAAKAKKTLVGKVNINTANEAQLTLLPGIGPAKARRIVEARKQKPFLRAAELVRVKGIGPKTVEKLLPHLAVNGHTDLRAL